jgi:hypothetical protein
MTRHATTLLRVLPVIHIPTRYVTSIILGDLHDGCHVVNHATGFFIEAHFPIGFDRLLA